MGVLMILGVTGCDNVSWGGADFAVVHPPEVNQPTEPEEVEGEAVRERLPEGPVLYYVSVTETGPVMTPVAEISGDSMIAIRAQGDARAYAGRFIAEHMRQGSEFALYNRGNRMGTFLIREAHAPAANACPALPSAQGTLELSQGAEVLREFLAISKPYAPEVGRRAGAPPQITRQMQVLGPILAERLLRARRAQLPGNWQRAMAQLIPFPVSGQSNAGYATTFLVDDTLGTGYDNEGYSLFYVGIPNQMSFDTAYVDFTNYPTEGKAAPRVVDYLDWNRDDQPELLLQVYGINDTWFEAVGRDREGKWRRIFRQRCEQDRRAPADSAR